MAQIYQEEDEAALNQPLLGNGRPTAPRQGPNRKEGKAQLRSSVGNLANTILGTGMLSFPLVCAPFTFSCMKGAVSLITEISMFP
jgi:hypothetical protein